MAFDNVGKLLSAPKYLAIWAISAAILMWLYIGPLTDHAMYNALGWIFAILFPVITGGVIAGQWYNLTERNSCPATATSGGVIGGILGIITVACPLCPAVLLGWIGLGAAIPAAILGGPWLKLISLVLLVLALNWSTSK
jgi:hypothetical protein